MAQTPFVRSCMARDAVHALVHGASDDRVKTFRGKSGYDCPRLKKTQFSRCEC
jgi:hypothetical protein